MRTQRLMQTKKSKLWPANRGLGSVEVNSGAVQMHICMPSGPNTTRSKRHFFTFLELAFHLFGMPIPNKWNANW